MIRRPPRSTQSRSSAASDVYKRQLKGYLPHNPSMVRPASYSVRQLSKLGFRFLQFANHSSFLFSAVQRGDFDALKKVLRLGELNIQMSEFAYLMTHLIEDIRAVGAMINAEHKSYVFLLAALDKAMDLHFTERLPIANQQSEAGRNKLEQELEARVFTSVLADSSLLKEACATLVNRNKSLLLWEVDGAPKLTLGMTLTETFGNFEATLPPFALVMRKTKSIGWKQFEMTCINSPNLSKYPMIEAFLEVRQNASALEILPNLLQMTKAMLDRFNYRITRADARSKSVDEVINNDEQLLRMFQQLRSKWNQHLNVDLNLQDSGSCAVLPSISLDNKSPLAILLPELRIERDKRGRIVENGVYAFAALNHLAGIQNILLDRLREKLRANRQAQTEEPMIVEPPTIALSRATDADIIKLPKDADLEKILQSHMSIPPEFGRGTQIEFDYDGISLALYKLMIIGKPRFDTQKLPTVSYLFEDSGVSSVYADLQRRLPQSRMEPRHADHIQEEITGMEARDPSGYLETVKALHGGIKLCLFYLSNYVSEEQRGLKLGDYLKVANVPQALSAVCSREPFASTKLTCLQDLHNFVERRLFELTQNELQAPEFDNESSNDTKKVLQEFIQKEDPRRLLHNLEMLKKFSLRRLSGLRVFEHSLKDCLGSVEVWNDIPDEAFETWIKTIPDSLKVSHFFILLQAIQNCLKEKSIFTEEDRKRNEIKEAIDESKKKEGQKEARKEALKRKKLDSRINDI
eukprot:TRINITY_DN1290_c0_g2_i4.p1 TRINITY_DN1290_c0_g2~~TRINITY_DN1290_c0_g2_i4.p1  ORF type:complete len:749 (+),score=187.77 TRINITY_DN1290_c0_g2_i4:47-2293(+)